MEDKITARLLQGILRSDKLLTKELPGKIILDLQSVYPFAALQIAGDPTWVILDQQLRVIGSRDQDPNVPTVIIPGPLL